MIAQCLRHGPQRPGAHVRIKARQRPARRPRGSRGFEYLVLNRHLKASQQ
jgi:hypothetical protein